jgi:imidazolonepropionase-like amidohydrolase
MLKLAVACLAVLIVGCHGPGAGGPAAPTAGSDASPSGQVIAVTGARIYPSPTAPPITDGTIVVTRGVITAVGPREQTAVPAGATVLSGAGRTVTAGFWNTHVHFTESKWQAADSKPAPELAADLRAMLTRWGVVHAVDVGSAPPNTLALRRRIESGEVPGPSIMLAGGTFVPVGGSPYYVLPLRLPELTDSTQAGALVDRLLDLPGIDGVKLFTGSWATRDSIVVMPAEVVRSAVEAAHRRGRPVFAHPSNSAGARAAIDGGVDVLAHTFPAGADWDRTLPDRMRAANMALTPTLKLWSWELGRLGVPPAGIARTQANAAEQVRAFRNVGGDVLFGTDVGYMTDYDPTEEYALLAQAGLSFPDVLAALTTAPAKRLSREPGAGVLAVGSPGDLVVLDDDPARDVRALARVRYTMRGGRIIYDSGK